MRESIDRRSLLRLLAATAGTAAPFAWSQQKPAGLPDGYPSRPVRVVVASAPGGSIDLTSRPVFARIQERWGNPFVMENRAGSTLAVDVAARAAPDGYTLMTASNSILFAAEQVVKVPYDVRTKFVPIAQMISTPYVISVNNDLPVTSIADLVAYAKANPRVLNYAFSAGGSASQLMGELLKMQAGIRMEAIGFKGVGPAYVEQMAGRIHVTMGTMTSSMPLVKAGKIRAIALTGASRSPAAPGVPTVRETLPNFDVFDSWVGLFGPEGLPAAIVTALNREINEVLALPEVRATLTADGSDVTPGPPEQLRETLISGLESARRIIRQANISIS